VIRPWSDWIAVADPPAEPQTEKTAGGLLLPPGTGLDVLNRGVVMAIGPDVEQPDGFGDGAMVWFPHGCAREVGSGELKFIREDCVVAWEGTLDHEDAEARS